jgi:hypothetical protein
VSKVIPSFKEKEGGERKLLDPQVNMVVPKGLAGWMVRFRNAVE